MAKENLGWLHMHYLWVSAPVYLLNLKRTESRCADSLGDEGKHRFRANAKVNTQSN